MGQRDSRHFTTDVKDTSRGDGERALGKGKSEADVQGRAGTVLAGVGKDLKVQTGNSENTRPSPSTWLVSPL